MVKEKQERKKYNNNKISDSSLKRTPLRREGVWRRGQLFLCCVPRSFLPFGNYKQFNYKAPTEGTRKQR